MSEIRSVASVSYDDAKGTIAVDWHLTQSNLKYWYERFDGPDNHWPVAMEIFIGEHDYVVVHVYAVEQNADMKEFENVREYLANQKKKGTIPVKRVGGEVTLSEVFTTMKRCDIMLFAQGFHDLNLTLEVTDD